MTKLSTNRIGAIFGSSVRAGVFRVLAALPEGRGASTKIVWTSVRQLEGFSDVSLAHVGQEIKALFYMGLADLHPDDHGYREHVWQLRSSDPVTRALADAALAAHAGTFRKKKRAKPV